MFNPLDLHQRSMVFIVFWADALMWSRSLPSARATRSSANACKYAGRAFIVNFNKSATIKFHKNGESMPPWGHPLFTRSGVKVYRFGVVR